MLIREPYDDEGTDDVQPDELPGDFTAPLSFWNYFDYSVYRDFLMESYDVQYPQYDFARNRGYGTENHRQALNQYGPSPIHRMSFEGLREGRLFD